MESETSLELDLLKSDFIFEKCKDQRYAQNLYAALCNNLFFKNNKQWTCSWRYAGGLVARLVDTNGDYMDYYCSGIGSNTDGYVGESEVTDEIRLDLIKIGWIIKPYEFELGNKNV